MSNLIFKLNSKNQIGVGTNKIELTNSLSSALNIKKNDDSYSFLEFNTSSNTISVGTDMAANDVITFKGTTKITTLSKGSLVYLDSSGNWVGLGTVGIGSYIQVNSGGTGLQWTGIKPSIALITKSPSHNSTISANSDNIILTFDEPIIAGTGNIVLTPSSGSAITIDVTNTSLVSFSSNVCTINPSSNLDATGLTYTVTMASGVIKNSNGDLFNGISGTAYQFNSKDTISATVSNVTSSTSNGSYKAGDSISIQVVFTETVIVTGTPQLTLETGTNVAVVNYASGSGSNTLTFTYTISSGHNSSDLDYKATSSLSLNGGTIKDAGDNSATLTLPSPGATGSLGANKAIIIDTTAPGTPTITGGANVTTNNTTPTVSGTAETNSTVTLTVPNATYTTIATSGNWSIDLSSATATSGSLSLNTNGDNTISITATDSAGNASGSTTQTLKIDTTPPTITSVTSTTANGTYGIGNSINITINFSENVTLSSGTITITLETGTIDRTVTINSFSNSNTASGNYTVQAGDTSSDLTVKTITLSSGDLEDIAGNAMSSFNIGTNLAASSAIVIDTTAPTITSVTSTTPNGTYDVGDTINITINFSENVTLSNGTITVTLETGTTDRTVTINSFSNSNTASGTYTVQAGDTSSDLTVKTIALSSGDLEDIAGNAMSSFNIGTNLAASSSIVISTIKLFSIKQYQFLTENSTTDPLNDTITSIPTWSTSLGDSYLYYQTKTGNWYNINNKYLILDIDFTTPSTNPHSNTIVIAHYGNYDNRGGYTLYYTGAQSVWPNISGETTTNRLIMSAEPKPWQAYYLKKTRTLNNNNPRTDESSGNFGLHYDGLLNGANTYNIKVIQGIGQKLNEQYLFIDGTLVARQDDWIESDISNGRLPSSNQTSGLHYFRIGRVGYNWPSSGMDPLSDNASIKINNYYIAESTNLWNNLLINTTFSVEDNPYATTDLRHYIWNQNLSGSSARGYVGYTWIRSSNTPASGWGSSHPANTPNFLYYETGSNSGGQTGTSQWTVAQGGYNNTIYAGNYYEYGGVPNQGRWGIRYDDNNNIADEHIWKFEYKGEVSGQGQYFEITNTQFASDYHVLGSTSAGSGSGVQNMTASEGSGSNKKWYCYVIQSGSKWQIKLKPPNNNAPTSTLYTYYNGSHTYYEYAAMYSDYSHSNYNVNNTKFELEFYDIS